MSEIWEASGKYVFRGKDCIGIFDTDTGTDAFMEERARVAAAAPDLLAACAEAASRLRYSGDLFHDQGNEMRAKADWAASEACEAAIAKATGTATVIEFPASELDQQIGGGGL